LLVFLDHIYLAVGDNANKVFRNFSLNMPYGIIHVKIIRNFTVNSEKRINVKDFRNKNPNGFGQHIEYPKSTTTRTSLYERAHIS